MSLAVAIQMDPIESINIDADSTFALMLEAQARGHALCHYLPRDLALHATAASAPAPSRWRCERGSGNHFTFGAPEELDLATMDVVLMRQDPPFDMAYITATHLLEHIHPKTLVVNDPASVRNAPEKLFVTALPRADAADADHRRPPARSCLPRGARDIIVKPLFGNGGAGVFHIKPGDENLNALLEMFTERSASR